MLEKITGIFIVNDENGKQKLNMAHGKFYIIACYLFSLWTLFCAADNYPFSRNSEAAKAVTFFIMAVLSAGAAFLFFMLIIKLRKKEEFGPLKIAVMLGIVNYAVCEIVNSESAFKEFIPFTLIGIFIYILVYMTGAILFPTPKI